MLFTTHYRTMPGAELRFEVNAGLIIPNLKTFQGAGYRRVSIFIIVVT